MMQSSEATLSINEPLVLYNPSLLPKSTRVQALGLSYYFYAVIKVEERAGLNSS